MNNIVAHNVFYSDNLIVVEHALVGIFYYSGMFLFTQLSSFFVRLMMKVG